MSVSKVLSSIGMNPDWTTQGKEAVVRTEFAIEEKKPYSAYIIDWLMPDMKRTDGVDEYEEKDSCYHPHSGILCVDVHTDFVSPGENHSLFCSKI